MEDKKNNAGIRDSKLQKRQDEKIQGKATSPFTLTSYFQSHS